MTNSHFTELKLLGLVLKMELSLWHEMNYFEDVNFVNWNIV